jgi:hypothetical protein
MDEQTRKFLKSKSRIRKRLSKIIRENEQIVRDIEWWNLNRADAPPFDVGGTLVLIKQAKDMLALVETNQRIPDETYNALLRQSEMLANDD